MIKDGLNLNTEKMASILMIGQSNMAGRGEFGEVEAINNSLCYMLRMGRWQQMSEPINPDRAIFDSEFHSGIGLAASFANEYAKHTNSSIGLIPCADGGTKLSQWMPGEVLFDHAVCMAKIAMRSSNINGIIWHQGESDCHCTENVVAYKDKFIYMITKLRKEIGAEKIPLIMGELSEEITPDWKLGNNPQKMNKIFYEIANEIEFCNVACAAGLKLKADGIHFNSESCREFGKRYFDKFLKTQGDNRFVNNGDVRLREKP